MNYLRTIVFYLTVTFIICGLITPSVAQQSTAGAPAASPPNTMMQPLPGFTQRGVQDDDYKIAPGDVLAVTFIGVDNMNSTATVQPDGAIILPLLNSVKAAGLSPAGLQSELTRQYAEYLKSPIITVTVQSFHMPTVWVHGQVKTPGGVRYQTGFGVKDYIASAGGFTDDADIAQIIVKHLNGTDVKVDLTSRSTEAVVLPAVYQDDVIFVGERKGSISVLGKVVKPGAYPITRGMRLSDAITQAGGGMSDGNLYAVEVKAGDKTLVFNQKAFLDNADTTQNPDLYPGDIVYVPESASRYYIYGAVHNPGAYRLEPNERILDTVQRAGGMIGGFAVSEMQVLRMENGVPLSLRFKLDDYMRKGDAAQNPLVQPADIVYIPDRKQTTSGWTKLSQAAIALAAFRGLLR